MSNKIITSFYIRNLIGQRIKLMIYIKEHDGARCITRLGGHIMLSHLFVGEIFLFSCGMFVMINKLVIFINKGSIDIYLQWLD